MFTANQPTARNPIKGAGAKRFAPAIKSVLLERFNGLGTRVRWRVVKCPYLTLRHIAIDTNYSTALGLMHPDYKEDAVYIETIGDVIRVNVLSALDLAVSKTARFQDNDKSDILALAQMGLLSESEFVDRANEALKYYVGNTDFIKYNIDDVVNMVESCRTQTPG